MKRVDEEVQEFAAALRPQFAGEIRTDRFSRLLYSTDASIYRIEPLAVLAPKGHEDVAAAVTLAARHGLPLLPRGGGTSLAGQTVGAAVILDFSKFMNRILKTNFEEAWVRVEPGVILDQLNASLLQAGWRYGPDVATGNRATIGGMIGNNSSGSHSIIYGITQNHVRSMRVLLATGEEVSFAEISADEWARRAGSNSADSRIYRSVGRIVADNREEIRARFPKIMRRVGGYNLDSVLGPARGNLSVLVVGSEGTLATCTEAVLGLEREPRAKGLDIVHFSDLTAAMDAMNEILALQPAAVELIDKMLLDLTRLQPAFARKMTFVEGDPDAVLVVEFFGDDDAEVAAKLDRLEQRLRAAGIGQAFVRAVRPEEQANVWAIRKAGLGLLSSMRGDAKPISFVEDTAVAPGLLGPYVRRFQAIVAQHGVRASFYGHASVGCLHVKPIINLKETSGVRQMQEISAAVKDLVIEFKGSMSAEHGDGIVRSHWNRELFGARLYEAFREVKAAFDPAGIMNPGKIVDAPPMASHLRMGPEYSTRAVNTRLDFSLEGGFARAIEQCNGMGVCRKLDTGAMCPSFMATREEEHSTRGRANALRAALSGAIPFHEYAGDRIYKALDLCLACKACKTECPAGVDMAKLKYEFLAAYNERHGTALRALVFGHIATLSRLGAATAPLSNWILRSYPVRKTVQSLLGVHPGRRTPAFVRHTFRRWLRRHPPHDQPAGAPKVVLFNDTFINYNEPWVGVAALRILENTGAQVQVPHVACCGRPMVSKGLLKEAKENARVNVARLAPLAEAGAIVVGCEPSCIITLRDEYPDLLGTPEARRLAHAVFSLEEYLCRRLDDGSWRPRFAGAAKRVLLHSHCHQKSLVGSMPSLRLLRLPPGYTAEEVDSGCCGMAGAFGYEKEHYEMSLQIGGMRLFPAIRNAPPDTLVVASGTSCRQQILHATGRKALHLAEVLAEALDLQEARS